VRYLLIALGALIAALVVGVFVLAQAPHLEVKSPPSAIGDQTPVTVHIGGKHGFSQITASIEQDGKSTPVVVAQVKRHRLGLFRNEAPRDVTFNIGRKTSPGLHEGKATVTIAAKANDLVGKTDAATFEVTVVTSPPRVVADGVQHYINQAGVELVSFTPSGYVTESGVQVGSRRFRSFPLPSDPQHQRFSLFALAWDQPVDSKMFAFATNPTGAVGQGTFWYKIFPKEFRSRDIELTDAFLEHAVNDIDPNGTGDLLERFLKINREMRVANNKQLADMRLETEEKWLWNKPFFAILGARESKFADKRTYIYKGKKVDEQVHLGFDIAGTQHMTIPSANDGRVIWADRLGIYGNCIVIDHGYGLQTIYGHLSEFLVHEGDRVKREQPIGKSGMTGLAGGDHLHFSMQLDGVQVNPIEWWDEHWIHDRIWSKVPAPAAP
jgi:murein DD-endopeptidase MepM/ murein hydrolase activator NlpD